MMIPPNLPLEGDPLTEVELTLDDAGRKHFALNGSRLQLVEPLDSDLGPSTIRFQVSWPPFSFLCDSRVRDEREEGRLYINFPSFFFFFLLCERGILISWFYCFYFLRFLFLCNCGGERERER